MTTVQNAGVGIHYHIEEGNGGEAPPILLTHGFSASGRAWRHQLPVLAGHRVVTWDMRGHALSDSPESPDDYSPTHTVTDMCAIVADAGIGKAIVGGHSLGGMMSFRYYAAHPEAVRALIIVGSGPGYRSEAPRLQWNEHSEARAKELEEKGLDALTNPSAEVMIARSEHKSAQGIAHTARRVMAQFDSTIIDMLPSVAVPTMIIVGENDTPFVGASEYMKKKIPDAKLAILKDAGHAVQIDQPDAFNEALLEFLDELPAE